MDGGMIITLVLSGIAVLVSAYTLRSNKRKIDAEVLRTEAETDDMRTGTALALLAPLEARVTVLEATVAKQAVEISALRAWGLANEELVRIHGGVPASLSDFKPGGPRGGGAT